MLMGCQGAWSPCNVLFRAIHVQDRATVYTEISFLEKLLLSLCIKHLFPSLVVGLLEFQSISNMYLLLSLRVLRIFNLPKFVKASPRDICNTDL